MNEYVYLPNQKYLVVCPWGRPATLSRRETAANERLAVRSCVLLCTGGAHQSLNALAFGVVPQSSSPAMCKL